jgi:hypothetical protein
MRRALLLTSLCLAGLLAAEPPAAALDWSGEGAAAASDVSAAKKKKRQRVYVDRAPQAAYIRHPWMDPSIAPDGRPYRNPYPPNVCSVDEGYGRFSPCTFRD